jgi:hypothetical protein
MSGFPSEAIKVFILGVIEELSHYTGKILSRRSAPVLTSFNTAFKQHYLKKDYGARARKQNTTRKRRRTHKNKVINNRRRRTIRAINGENIGPGKQVQACPLQRISLAGVTFLGPMKVSSYLIRNDSTTLSSCGF